MKALVAFVDEGLGNSSYLIDLGDGRAAAIDPWRDPTPYLAGAERLGLRLAFSVETHLHADFVSGSCELAAHGAQVIASASSGIPHRGLRDGDELNLGGLTLRALTTPGHTPEHLSYLVLDDDRPLALFSGGSLLVGAVARTDLIAPERTEELARALWRCLHERILGLPDDVPVYPTHGAGSFCSSPSGADRTTTIGRERTSNPLLSAPGEDAFTKLLLDRLGSYPPYFGRLREVNRRGPKVYGREQGSLDRLDVDEVRRRVAAGGLIVDVRPIAAFAAGHITQSLSIPLRDQFATWLGWLVEADKEVIFVLDPDQDRADVVRQARKVGYERLAGELAGGMEAWQAAGMALARIPLVPAAGVTGRVLDVRQRAEYTSGHVPGAAHVELGDLATTELDPGPWAVMCGHGERAMSAASILAARGHHKVSVVVGGPDDWSAATGQDLQADG